MKIGDPVRFHSSVGVIVDKGGWSPYYGQIWEVFLPSCGRSYSLGEFRLKKINEKNT